ncbi:hypothetical protein EON63_13150 [archaeon]|nr:MAG: hypothetical protein EON63_13150 [archaeon]
MVYGVLWLVNRCTCDGKCLSIHTQALTPPYTIPHSRLCPGPKSSCQSPHPVPLTLEVLSTHPKAFYISHFLSDVEAQGIVDIAAPQIKDSYVGRYIVYNLLWVVY